MNKDRISNSHNDGFRVIVNLKAKLSPFQIRKARYFFNVNLDIENKGYLKWDDVEFYILFHMTVAGQENDAALEQNLRNTTREIWELIQEAYPSDGSVKVTYGQFLDFWASLAQHIRISGEMPRCLREWIKAGFQLYDSKGSGTIKPSSFYALYNKMGISMVSPATAFRALTESNQKSMTLEYITNLAKRVIASSDANDYSAYLLPGFEVNQDSRKARNLEQQTQRSSKSLPRKDKHGQHKIDTNPTQGNHTGKENINRPNRTTERRLKRDRQSRRFTSMSNLSECKQETKNMPCFEGKGDVNVKSGSKVYTQSPTGSTSLQSPHFSVRGDRHRGPPPQVPNRTDASPFMASYTKHPDGMGNLPNVQQKQSKYQQHQSTHNDKTLICQILTDMNINPSECEILIDSDNVQQSTIPLSPCPTLSNAEVRPSPIASSNYSGYYSDNAARMASMPRNVNTFYTQHVVPPQYQMVHPRPPVNFHARMDHIARPHMAVHQGYAYTTATATLHHCPPAGSSSMVNAEQMGGFRDKRNIPINKQTSRPPYRHPHVFDNNVSMPIMMNSLPCEPFSYDHSVMQGERLANSLDHPSRLIRNTRAIPIDRATNPASVAPAHLSSSNQHNAIVKDVIQRIRPLIKEIVQEELRKANQKWVNARQERDSAAFSARRKEDMSQDSFIHNRAQLHHNHALRDWEGVKRQKDDQGVHHPRSQAGTKSESKDAHGMMRKQGINASRIQDISHSESLPSASFDDEFWRGESGQSPAVNKMIFDKLLRQKQSGKRTGDYKEKQRLGVDDEMKESEDDIAQKDDQSVEGLSPASDATSELSDSALNDEMIFIPGVGGFGTFLPVNIGPGFVQEAAYPNFFVSMNAAEEANVIDPKAQASSNEKRNGSHKEDQQGNIDAQKGKERQKDRVDTAGSKRNGVSTHTSFLDN